MSKKQYNKEEKTKDQPEGQEVVAPQPQMPQLPPELKEKLEKIKKKLETFSKKIVDKFGKYIVGVGLLPPPQPRPGMSPEELKELEAVKDKIHALVLVDDSEPSKMTKEEMNERLDTIIKKSAEEVDKDLLANVIMVSALWQDCYDGKYDKLQMIAMSAPVHDTGMLSAIKIAEVHKTMTLKKFEKYIVAYVLAGSIVQGRATKESDIDVFLIVDDTDVKKMSRLELKDKLRQIILGMGFQAGEMTGIRNKINIQVYILTDFWESVKEAHPVIFTFLRDGVPFFDRGIFMPWKQLLKMGRIKPSPEAIDMYMSTGEQMIQRIRMKIREIGIEDLFWSTLTPSQAAIMMYGLPPPTPKETPGVLREVFVKKEKLLEEEDVKIMDELIRVRKELEHGGKKDITGKQLDEMLEGAEKYLKRIRKLFTQLEKIKEEETVVQLYDTVTKILRDVLSLRNLFDVKEDDLMKTVKKELTDKGTLSGKQHKQVQEIFKAKEDYEAGKLVKSDFDKIRKESGELLRFLIETVQRERGREIAKTKFHVKYGEKFGEVILLEDKAFIIQDIDAEDKVVEKVKVDKEGRFGPLEKSSYEELEKSISETQIPRKVFIHEPVFESLKSIFGKDVRIMVHH
ncbi:nucleotidyltransferase domain-containing protein [Candidatus Woesearchaeota archaeon]|nr:nucleotidyltransferase domain-containing protein [Candidatus Woesearchaeota archaeon]